jgi:myosin tail region-interacting protein MTI1
MGGAFTQAAEIGQYSAVHEDERAEAASSPPITGHGQHATDDSGAAQAHDERASLAPTLSADDSDDEMAPPRVTRPLPAAPDVNIDLAAALARTPPPPSVPKRTSLPPPVRTIPVPSTDSPPRIQGSSPQRVPTVKRTSLLPPPRETPSPTPDTLDVVSSLRAQHSTRRTSLPPPARRVPSPSVSREGSLVTPPPPPSLSYSEQDSQEPGQTKQAPRTQDEFIVPPPPPPPPPPVLTPTRKPSIAPPTPDGRRIVESRRSSDSRLSQEERRGSVQYAILTTPGPTSPPSKKRIPPPLPLEKEVLDEDIGGTPLLYYGSWRATDTTLDPIDPLFYAPAKSPNIPPRTPSPTSGMDPLASVPPATPPSLPSADESGTENLQRRRTIAERMAKLGAIKFGVPPPVNRVQPSAPTLPAEDAGAEGSTADAVQSAPEEEEDEEDEQARRQRIAAKIAGMGGMRFGMLPIQPGIVSVTPPPPPPITVRPEEEATPRSPPRDISPPRQPAAHYHEHEQEYEQPSSSDDGVRVEAEESELEEVRYEDLEDEYDGEVVEEERVEAPSPPPPPPRSTRPPVPPARPSIPIALLPGRSGSFSTITPGPRPPVRHSVSEFVMVEPEGAPLPSSSRYSRVPSAQWSAPPPPLESSDLAGSGQWELPSIPSGSFDLGNNVITGDLSGSMWSEDSTAYPPAARLSVSPPPTGAPQQPAGQPRAPAPAAPAQMTADELRALWYRVGAYVAEAASRLLERSKRTLVGNGSYESFIAEALSQVPNASPPHGPGEYGFLIYAQTAAQVHTRLTDIMPGDVVVLDGAKLKGYKGLHTYSMSAGEGAPCMGVVSEFDLKKLKLKALQASQRVGQAVRICVVGGLQPHAEMCIFLDCGIGKLQAGRSEEWDDQGQDTFSMPPVLNSHSLLRNRFIAYGKHEITATENNITTDIEFAIVPLHWIDGYERYGLS